MKNEDHDLRKGKWTSEEEVYSNKIIQLFNQGMLPLSAGTTLRSYLSDKLKCDPMRITKKFAGASCIGKQVFHPCDNNDSNNAAKKESMAELERLEKIFCNRVYSKSVSNSARHQAQQQLYQQQQQQNLALPQQSPGGRGVKHKQNPSTAGRENSTSPSARPRKNSKEHASPNHEFSTSRYNSRQYALTDSKAGLISRDSFASTESLGAFQKNKRVMSAPDLTQLSMLATAAPMYEGDEDDSTSGISRLSSSATDESHLHGIAFAQTSPFSSSTTRKSPAKQVKRTTIGSRASSNNSHVSHHGTRGHLRNSLNSSHSTSLNSTFNGSSSNSNSNNSSNSHKKSHSVMDLVNYEKLAADDHLAGEMFFQFVQQLGTKYQDRDQNNSNNNDNSDVSMHTSSSTTSLAGSTNSDNNSIINNSNMNNSSHTNNVTRGSGANARSTGTTPSPHAASKILNQFLTIDDVISCTVAQDFSSFSVSDTGAAGAGAAGSTQLSNNTSIESGDSSRNSAGFHMANAHVKSEFSHLFPIKQQHAVHSPVVLAPPQIRRFSHSPPPLFTTVDNGWIPPVIDTSSLDSSKNGLLLDGKAPLLLSRLSSHDLTGMTSIDHQEMVQSQQSQQHLPQQHSLGNVMFVDQSQYSHMQTSTSIDSDYHYF